MITKLINWFGGLNTAQTIMVYLAIFTVLMVVKSWA